MLDFFELCPDFANLHQIRLLEALGSYLHFLILYGMPLAKRDLLAAVHLSFKHAILAFDDFRSVHRLIIESIGL